MTPETVKSPLDQIQLLMSVEKHFQPRLAHDTALHESDLCVNESGVALAA